MAGPNGARAPRPGSHGGLAEEAGLLLVALHGWARDRLGEPGPVGGASECSWCPLCRLAAVVRAAVAELPEPPELTVRLAAAAATLSEALTVMAAGLRPPGDGQGEGQSEGQSDGLGDRPGDGPVDEPADRLAGEGAKGERPWR